MIPDTGPFPSRSAYQEMLENVVSYEADLEQMCAKGQIDPRNAARSVHRIACERVLAILRQPRPLEARDFDAIHAEMMGIFEQDFCSGSSIGMNIGVTQKFLDEGSDGMNYRAHLGEALRAAVHKQSEPRIAAWRKERGLDGAPPSDTG